MEVLGLVAGVILLVIIFCSESDKLGGYERGDLRISRDSNGQYYVYEVKTGREVYRANDRQACADFVKKKTN